MRSLSITIFSALCFSTSLSAEEMRLNQPANFTLPIAGQDPWGCEQAQPVSPAQPPPPPQPPSAEESFFDWDPPYEMGGGQLTGVESPFIPAALRRPNRERPGDWIFDGPLNRSARPRAAVWMAQVPAPVIGVFVALFAMRPAPCVNR